MSAIPISAGFGASGHENTSDVGIQGVEIGDLQYKLAMYVDDLLLFINDPKSSIPHLMTAISEFSVILGYTINWSKLVAMLLNVHACKKDLSGIPIK